MADGIADFLLIGSGLGATAAARHLASAGASVVVVPGIGRTRSPHVDGGIVDPAIVEQAFGPGAPLGDAVSSRQELRLAGNGGFEAATQAPVTWGRMYRRSVLETWAMKQATGAGAIFLDDVVEGKALPNADGTMTLTSERDERTIRARTIILCEGADPRIPLRVRLRPDYGPEDQVHFARTLIQGAPEPVLRRGRWRTSWGMPVDVSVIPQQDGTLISVSTRIENVMRCGRSSKDALENLLQSRAFVSLDIQGVRGETGVELVALRPDWRNMAFTHDSLLMGIDASGVIDARRDDRADLTIQAGMRLAAWLASSAGTKAAWDVVARQWIDKNLPAPATYHDDRATGFLEEAPTAQKGARITNALARLMRPRR